MKNKQKIKQAKLQTRKKRVRARVMGSGDRPRLNVYRSTKHLFVQLINDDKGLTVVSAHDRELKKGLAQMDKAKEIGKLIAKKALAKKIDQVVFDRGGRPFHGRIKAVAEGAREGGLKF